MNFLIKNGLTKDPTFLCIPKVVNFLLRKSQKTNRTHAARSTKLKNAGVTCMLHNKCILCQNKLKLIMGDISDIRFGMTSEYCIALCNSCYVMQTVPVPDSEKLISLYKKYYNFGGEKGTLYARFRDWFLSSILYQFWIFMDGDISFHRHRGTGGLLDVGCNEGRGLEIYQQNGFKAEGLEINERAAIEARKRGFIVYAEPLEEIQSTKTYDIVVLSNVLEHSLQPKKMLAHVAGILKPGGQVWISCPNFDSWQRSFFGNFWINWHVPFHRVHFSQVSLSKLLWESGFEIQIIRQKSPSLWMTQSIIARLFARPRVPTNKIRNPFLVASLMLIIRCLIFPVLWLGNYADRGDCLIIEARKR